MGVLHIQSLKLEVTGSDAREEGVMFIFDQFLEKRDSLVFIDFDLDRVVIGLVLRPDKAH
jgi:hypothetical protein